MTLLASLSKSRLGNVPRIHGVVPFAEAVAEWLPDAALAALCHETAFTEFVPSALESLGRHADAARVRLLRGTERKGCLDACAALYNGLTAEKAAAPDADRERIDGVGEVLRCALNALDYSDLHGTLPNFMQGLVAFDRLHLPEGLSRILGFYARAANAIFYKAGQVIARTHNGWALLREDPDGLHSFVGERSAVAQEVRPSHRDRVHLLLAGGLRHPEYPVVLDFPDMWRRPKSGTLPVRVLFIGNFMGVDNAAPIEDRLPLRVSRDRWAAVDKELTKHNKEGKPSLWTDFHRTFDRFDATLPNLEAYVLPATHDEMWMDVEDAPEPSKQGLFKLLHTAEFGGAGGTPYTVAFVFTKIVEGDILHRSLRFVAANCCLPMFINGKLDVADDASLTHYRRLIECPSVTGHVLHKPPALFGNAFARYGAPLDVPQLDPDVAAWMLGARVAQHLKVLHRHWMGRRLGPYSVEGELNAWLAGFVGGENDPTKPFGQAQVSVGGTPEGNRFPFELTLLINSGLAGVPPRKTTVFGRLDCE